MTRNEALAAVAEAQVEALSAAYIVAEELTTTDYSDPVAASQANIDTLKRVYLIAKARTRSFRTVQTSKRGHAKRLALEEEFVTEWTANMRALAAACEANIDAAYAAAQWTMPPPDPEDGVLVGQPSFLNRVPILRVVKEKLSQPRKGDIEEVTKWGSSRGEVAREALQSGNAMVIRNSQGQPIAVAEVHTEGAEIVVRKLAAVAAPHGETPGRDMLQALGKDAMKNGSKLTVIPSTPKQTEYFRALGMSDWAGAAPPTFMDTAEPALEMAGQTLAQFIVQPGAPPDAALVQRSLMQGVNTEAMQSGAYSRYLGLSTKVGETAGQVSLDHLGLHKTFEFAHPQNMAQALYEVRGSKLVQQAYGNHINKLTKIITDATNPKAPLTIQETKARIRTEWPKLTSYEAERIARTETAALWTATAANAYAANGITEWESSVATGPSVMNENDQPCDLCFEESASIHSMDDLNQPPWHPMCRCEMIPVLSNEDGEPWLPPDEPWTGGDMAAGETLGPGRLVPAPEPGANMGGWNFASALLPTGAEKAALKGDISKWSEAAKKPGGAPRVEHKKRAVRLVDTGPSLYIMRGTDGLAYGVSSYETGTRLAGSGKSWWVHRIETDSGSRYGMLRAQADAAWRENADYLAIDSKDIPYTMRRSLLDMGFRPTPTQTDVLRLPRQDMPAAFKLEHEHTPVPEEVPDVRPPTQEATARPDGGLPDVHFTEAPLAEFNEALSGSPYSEFITLHTEAEAALDETKMYLSADRLTGFAVTKDGDLQNVFSLPGAPKGAGQVAIRTAVDEKGAVTLDCYDGFLPDLYAKFGFKVTGRMKFNTEYAQDGWNYEKFNHPDVTFMALNPAEGFAERTFDDWFRAKEYALKLTSGTKEEAAARDFALAAGDVAANEAGGVALTVEALPAKRLRYEVATKENHTELLNWHTEDVEKWYADHIPALTKNKGMYAVAHIDAEGTMNLDVVRSFKIKARAEEHGMKANEDTYLDTKTGETHSLVPAEGDLPRETLLDVQKLGLENEKQPMGAVARALFDPENGIYSTADKWAQGGVWKAQRAEVQQKIIQDAFKGKVKPPPDEKEFYMTAGGPASGKGGSTFRYKGKDLTLDELEAQPDVVTVNCDLIKAALPEFKAMAEGGDVYAGTGVHRESVKVALALLKKATNEGYNVVLDGAFADTSYLEALAKIKGMGYKTSVTLTSVPMRTAIIRMMSRGKIDGRYVPVPKLIAAHKGSSRMFQDWRDNDVVDEWRVFDNSGKEGKPTLVAEKVAGGKEKVYEPVKLRGIEAKATDNPPELLPSLPEPVPPIKPSGPPVENWQYADGEIRMPQETQFPPGYKEWKADLSAKDEKVLHGYSSLDSRLINSRIIQGVELKPHDAAIVESINATIGKAPLYDEPVTVWRGIAGPSYDPDVTVANLMERFPPGTRIHPQGFQSTTFTPLPATHASPGSTGVVFEIKARQGVMMEEVSKYPEEQELLLSSHEEWEVKRITKETFETETGKQVERYVVQVEQIPNTAAMVKPAEGLTTEYRVVEAEPGGFEEAGMDQVAQGKLLEAVDEFPGKNLSIKGVIQYPEKENVIYAVREGNDVMSVTAAKVMKDDVLVTNVATRNRTPEAMLKAILPAAEKADLEGVPLSIMLLTDGTEPGAAALADFRAVLAARGADIVDVGPIPIAKFTNIPKALPEATTGKVVDSIVIPQKVIPPAPNDVNFMGIPKDGMKAEYGDSLRVETMDWAKAEGSTAESDEILNAAELGDQATTMHVSRLIESRTPEGELRGLASIDDHDGFMDTWSIDAIALKSSSDTDAVKQIITNVIGNAKAKAVKLDVDAEKIGLNPDARAEVKAWLDQRGWDTTVGHVVDGKPKEWWRADVDKVHEEMRAYEIKQPTYGVEPLKLVEEPKPLEAEPMPTYLMDMPVERVGSFDGQFSLDTAEKLADESAAWQEAGEVEEAMNNLTDIAKLGVNVETVRAEDGVLRAISMYSRGSYGATSEGTGRYALERLITRYPEDVQSEMVAIRSMAVEARDAEAGLFIAKQDVSAGTWEQLNELAGNWKIAPDGNYLTLDAADIDKAFPVLGPKAHALPGFATKPEQVEFYTSDMVVKPGAYSGGGWKFDLAQRIDATWDARAAQSVKQAMDEAFNGEKYGVLVMEDGELGVGAVTTITSRRLGMEGVDVPKIEWYAQVYSRDSAVGEFQYAVADLLKTAKGGPWNPTNVTIAKPLKPELEKVLTDVGFIKNPDNLSMYLPRSDWDMAYGKLRPPPPESAPYVVPPTGDLKTYVFQHAQTDEKMTTELAAQLQLAAGKFADQGAKQLIQIAAKPDPYGKSAGLLAPVSKEGNIEGFGRYSWSEDQAGDNLLKMHVIVNYTEDNAALAEEALTKIVQSATKMAEEKGAGLTVEYGMGVSAPGAGATASAGEKNIQWAKTVIEKWRGKMESPMEPEGPMLLPADSKGSVKSWYAKPEEVTKLSSYLKADKTMMPERPPEHYKPKPPTGAKAPVVPKEPDKTMVTGWKIKWLEDDEVQTQIFREQADLDSYLTTLEGRGIQRNAVSIEEQTVRMEPARSLTSEPGLDLSHSRPVTPGGVSKDKGTSALNKDLAGHRQTEGDEGMKRHIAQTLRDELRTMPEWSGGGDMERLATVGQEVADLTREMQVMARRVDTLAPSWSPIPASKEAEQEIADLKKKMESLSFKIMEKEKEKETLQAASIESRRVPGWAAIRKAYGYSESAYGEGGDEAVVSQLINNWARTSSDSDARGVAVQLAIKEEFGLETDAFAADMLKYGDPARNKEIVDQAQGLLDGTITYEGGVPVAKTDKFSVTYKRMPESGERGRNLVDETQEFDTEAQANKFIEEAKAGKFNKPQPSGGAGPQPGDIYVGGNFLLKPPDTDIVPIRPAMRAFVRAQYNETQRYLTELGVEDVTIYRGLSLPRPTEGDLLLPDAPFGMKNVPIGLNTLRLGDNPISSWSIRHATSKGCFYGGTMLRASVPKEMVFSTPYSGFGCANEWELTVLNRGDNMAWVAQTGTRSLTEEDVADLSAKLKAVEEELAPKAERYKELAALRDGQGPDYNDPLRAEMYALREETYSLDNKRAALDGQLRSGSVSWSYDKETDLKKYIEEAIKNDHTLAGKDIVPPGWTKANWEKYNAAHEKIGDLDLRINNAKIAIEHTENPPPGWMTSDMKRPEKAELEKNLAKLTKEQDKLKAQATALEEKVGQKKQMATGPLADAKKEQTSLKRKITGREKKYDAAKADYDNYATNIYQADAPMDFDKAVTLLTKFRSQEGNFNYGYPEEMSGWGWAFRQRVEVGYALKREVEGLTAKLTVAQENIVRLEAEAKLTPVEKARADHRAIVYARWEQVRRRAHGRR